MQEIKGHRQGYKLIKVHEKHWELCKILNEYDNEQDAENDLLGLLTNSKSEKDILKDYSKKDII